MARAWIRAVRQVGDPAFAGVLWRAVGLTFLAYAAAGAAAWYGIQALPLIGIGWADTLIEILSSLGLVVLMVVMFPAVATLFAGLFLDDVAAAVEAKHYPADRPGRPLPFAVGLGLSLRFLMLVLLANLVALPFYLLLVWLPPAGLFIFYGLNGYLLGREYFELIALRHVDRNTGRRLRLANSGRIWVNGAVMAFLLTIPLINLLVPLVATAAMVHIFKDLATES